MPISIDAFENDTPPRAETPHQIVTFLAAHTERAYTPAEIGGTLGLDHETVVTALDELADRDLVRQAGDDWTVAEGTGDSCRRPPHGDPSARRRDRRDSVGRGRARRATPERVSRGRHSV